MKNATRFSFTTKASVDDDEFFMKMALALAAHGRGRVHPNPLVGAVLVKNGRVIGQGAHDHFGGPHAEVNAIHSARESVAGATLYVTLEPCAHFGKTPPCTELLIQKKISRVVVGTRDPNSQVAGRGIQSLRKAGLKVLLGVCEIQARRMNRDFFYWIQHRTPYVIVKVAQSLDGKIATSTGQSRWITGPEARTFSHELRADSDAICVGINTVLKDNPSLNVRLRGVQANPIKIVMDRQLRTPIHARLFSEPKDSKVLIVTSAKASKKKKLALSKKAEVLVAASWASLLKDLGRRGIVNLLIEGGGEVIASALKARVVREAYFFVAPILIGGQSSAGSVGGLGIQSLKDSVPVVGWKCRSLGNDFLIHGEVDV